MCGASTPGNAGASALECSWQHQGSGVACDDNLKTHNDVVHADAVRHRAVHSVCNTTRSNFALQTRVSTHVYSACSYLLESPCFLCWMSLRRTRNPINGKQEVAHLYSASCCLLGSTSSVRATFAQYMLYRAPSDAMITSYRSLSSLLIALTCVNKQTMCLQYD